MKKAAVVFGLVISLTAIGFAQVRTITNATLDKFTQKRLAADRDYRDNYARMGFPSPEELDRQRDEDMRARLELADQLRQARLEKERLELEQRRLNVEAFMIDSQIETDRTSGFYGGYYGGFGIGGFGIGGYSFGDRFGRFRGRHFPFFGSGLPESRITPFGVIPVNTPRPQRILRGRSIGHGKIFRGRRR